MSIQASTPYLLRRVATRAGLGLWRHRGGVLLAAIVAIGLGTYVSMTGASADSLLAATPFGSPPAATGANGDCADTAMAAIADKSAGAAHGAYLCMDTAFRQRVSEQAFAQQMQSQKMPNVSKLARVGDYRTPSGGTMVYYAMDGGGQSVGYIVYLGQDGKVLKIE